MGETTNVILVKVNDLMYSPSQIMKDVALNYVHLMH